MASFEHGREKNLQSPNVLHTQQQLYHQRIIIGNTGRNVKLSYCELHVKNKPQSNSVTGGILLLFVSGMHIGWGIWRIMATEPWALNRSMGIIQFALMSWFVFAVLGSVVTAVLVTTITKKSIYYIGGALLVTSSVIFIGFSKQHEAIIVGRCLAGFSHGIIYNATITHATENVVKEIRGMLLSTINCILFSGVFVGSTLIGSVANNYSVDMTGIFGIVGLVMTVSGVICTIFLTYETIPFLLRRGNESEAIANLLKLRNESVMTPKLTDDLEEMKLMVDQDERESKNILADGNGSVTGKMIALRILSVMANNFLINNILISLVASVFNVDSSVMILCGCRFIGSLIPVFSTDFFKRKSHLAVSSVTSGLLMLTLAIIIAAVTFQWTPSYWIIGALCIAFQIFVSIGIDPMQHLLLSEAFSTSKKAWSIAVVTSVEHCLQILLIGVSFADSMDTVRVNATLFVTAVVMMTLALFHQLAIPETFRKSIKETRDLFR